MSSTTNIQNLLVNVFRPVYRYDPLTTLFTPKLEISNIDTYSGNTISVFNAAVGDSGFNVYVGSNAGNAYTAIRNCINNTAIGYDAGASISNVSNSTYLGYNAGNGANTASNVIGIGANAGGNGISNIFLGNGTKSTGSNNILIGHGIDAGSNNNLFRIGSTIYGNLSNNWIGIGTSTPNYSDDRLDVSGNMYLGGQLGINITAGQRTLDVNGDFRASDGSGNTLDFNDGITKSTAGFTSVQQLDVAIPIGATTIGTIKSGIIHVSAVDQEYSGVNRAAYIYFAYTASNVTVLASSSNGDTNIITSGSNIQLSNATGEKYYKYSITYFPLP